MLTPRFNAQLASSMRPNSFKSLSLWSNIFSASSTMAPISRSTAVLSESARFVSCWMSEEKREKPVKKSMRFSFSARFRSALTMTGLTR